VGAFVTQWVCYNLYMGRQKYQTSAPIVEKPRKKAKKK